MALLNTPQTAPSPRAKYFILLVNMGVERELVEAAAAYKHYKHLNFAILKALTNNLDSAFTHRP